MWEIFEEENRDKTLKRPQEIREIVYELGHDIYRLCWYFQFSDIVIDEALNPTLW